MSKGTVLIYGANGYSGRLAALHAKEFGIDATLAGRSESKVAAVAAEAGLPFIAFDLNPSGAIDEHIAPFTVVLNCAGPFTRTANLLLQACLRTGTHYTDITGELEVIELCSRMERDAKHSKIVIMPATGFDVVPTDTVARYLSEKMPDATHLDLAFSGSGGLSHGTATTMIENLGGSSSERQAGEIVPVPVASRTRTFDFGRGEQFCMSIPWGDVSSAFHTTGIENIVTYTAVPERAARGAAISNRLAPLLRSRLVKKAAQAWLDRKVTGPSNEEREGSSSYVVGVARNAKGESISARLTCPSGYKLTYIASLKIAGLIAEGTLPDGTAIEPGFHTPAGLFGVGFLCAFDDVTLEDI